MLTTLAHLELMMLFDECNIMYNRKKTRRKASGNSSPFTRLVIRLWSFVTLIGTYLSLRFTDVVLAIILVI